MARVFISFVNEDKNVAEALQKLIRKELGLRERVFMSGRIASVLAGHLCR
jgi:hypothetical protein